VCSESLSALAAQGVAAPGAAVCQPVCSAAGEGAGLAPLSGRYTYLKIKAKIKHLQKLKLNMFLAKIKYSLDNCFSNFVKKIEKVCRKFAKF